MIGRALTGAGALFCGASVALGAYASHAAEGQARERIAIAALFAFAHGLALLLLSARRSRIAGAARIAFFAGTLLFSGSLASAGFFSTPTGAAPIGGMLLMLGWLLAAVEFWQDERGGDGPV